jgi:hypothetical protein
MGKIVPDSSTWFSFLTSLSYLHVGLLCSKRTQVSMLDSFAFSSPPCAPESMSILILAFGHDALTEN